MAVTTTPISSGLASNIVKDTDSDNTSEDDVRSGAATVFVVKVNNDSNAALTYTKLYDAASPTVGTTDPDIVLMTPASSTREFWVGGSEGIAFTTGISFASVTAGGTGGTTAPTSNVQVDVFTS